MHQTVKQLAEAVGAPVERLLSQMKDAELPHTNENDLITDEQKKALLQHVRKAHRFDSNVKSKQITMKRKQSGANRTSPGRGGKTVNVEVRKKRTFVKRSSPAETITGEFDVATVEDNGKGLVEDPTSLRAEKDARFSHVRAQKARRANAVIESLLSRISNDVGSRKINVEILSSSKNLYAVTCDGQSSIPQPINYSVDLRRKVTTGNASSMDIKTIGAELWGLLISNEQFVKAYEQRTVGATRKEPLSIVISFEERSASWLSELPWESLYDTNNSRLLGIDLEVRLLRKWVNASHRSHVRHSSSGRFLVGISSPTRTESGSAVAHLQQIQEWQAFRDIQARLGPGKAVAFDYSHRLGLDTLVDSLSDAMVFHYSGHGREGELVLQSLDGVEEKVSGVSVAAALANPVPKLVVLNACRSSLATTSQRPMAEAFLKRGVPFVISMAGDLSDESALEFVREFYLRLMGGLDFESCLQHARWKLFALGRSSCWFLLTGWARIEGMIYEVPANLKRDLQFGTINTELQIIEEEQRELQIRVLVLEKVDSVADRLELAPEEMDDAVNSLVLNLKAGKDTSPEAVDELVSNTRRMRSIIGQARENELSEGNQALKLTQQLQSTLIQTLKPLRELPSFIEVVAGRTKNSEVPEPQVVLGVKSDPPLKPSIHRSALKDIVEFVTSGFSIDEQIVKRCVLHLLAGRHLVLVGPPGTGKSTLALRISEALGYFSHVVTANPDWSTFDVIGGLAPAVDNTIEGSSSITYRFRPGCFVEAINKNWEIIEAGPNTWTRNREINKGEFNGTWLIIDEMNRAPLDQAFGDLFTALISKELLLPRMDGNANLPGEVLPIPEDFRLLCTANTSDKHLLFQMSGALKRRFAYVEIPAVGAAWPYETEEHHKSVRVQVRGRGSVSALGLSTAEIEQKLIYFQGIIDPIIQCIRVVHPLGTASVIDVLTYSLVARELDVGNDEVVEWALADQIGVLLEDLDLVCIELLIALLQGTIDADIEHILGRGLSHEGELDRELRVHVPRLTKVLLKNDEDTWIEFCTKAEEALKTSGSGAWIPVLDACPKREYLSVTPLPGANRLIQMLRQFRDDR